MRILEATPTIIERSPQPYVGAPDSVPMSLLSRVADSIPKLESLIAQHGEAPAGPPFFRYLTIDMERELEVEAGVPVTTPVTLGDANRAVRSDTLPGGRFVSAFYVGHPDGLLDATAELLEWAEAQGLQWDMTPDGPSERWGCRLEIYHTDPLEQPDMNAWRTELAFRLA
jgi:effector-binding domain-containing protein